MPVPIDLALTGTGIDPTRLNDNEFLSIIDASVLQKLCALKIIPLNGKLLSTPVRGTSYADPNTLKSCHTDWLAGKNPAVNIAYEPTNPKPPAFKVTYQEKPIGYIPAELAIRLRNRKIHFLKILKFTEIAPSAARHKNSHAIDMLIAYGPLYSDIHQ